MPEESETRILSTVVADCCRCDNTFFFRISLASLLNQFWELHGLWVLGKGTLMTFGLQ